MVFGMFMAILDIQIVSASLAEIQAGLSASADEISWVQTSYLIAEVIMIPLSGTSSRVLSTRWMFVDLGGRLHADEPAVRHRRHRSNEMIVWRALQGFIGGGMIPTVFAAAFTIFPPQKRPIVSPVIGLVATLAPTIGPTVGGYLTDLFSWHWLFLVNIVPGIVVTISTYLLVDFDEPNSRLFKTLRLVGPRLHGGLPRQPRIRARGGPEQRLVPGRDRLRPRRRLRRRRGRLLLARAHRRASRSSTCAPSRTAISPPARVFSFVLGIGLYGLTYLYPLYLARVRGYSALQIGETMFVTGIFMFLTAPVAGRL